MRLVLARFGGGSEIRTHGPVSQTPVFKTGAIDHSAIPPGFECALEPALRHSTQ
ncbi:MAG: hypothetical protein RLZZ234_528 [Candidatus Parcubacteria bacterium]